MAVSTLSVMKKKARDAVYQAAHREEIKAYCVTYYAANREKVIARQAAWRKAYPEKKKARAVAYSAEHPEVAKKYRAVNREKRKAQKAAWDAANAEKVKAYSAANWEKKKAQNAAWGAAHPEVCLAYTHRRRARARKAKGRFTADDVKRIRAAQKDKCAVCRVPLKGRGHRDHIVPLVAGGSNWPRNIQLLCGSCNCSKGPKDPHVFMRERGMLL